MPKMSKQTAEHEAAGPAERWHAELDGYSVDFISWKADLDSSALLKGLPGDRCTCPHWGYVLKGKITYTFEDHEEVHEAGDAFYVPGGHSPRFEAGTEFLQFSPAAELQVVSETIEKNLRQMQEA